MHHIPSHSIPASVTSNNYLSPIPAQSSRSQRSACVNGPLLVVDGNVERSDGVGSGLGGGAGVDGQRTAGRHDDGSGRLDARRSPRLLEAHHDQRQYVADRLLEQRLHATSAAISQRLFHRQ